MFSSGTVWVEWDSAFRAATQRGCSAYLSATFREHGDKTVTALSKLAYDALAERGVPMVVSAFKE